MDIDGLMSLKETAATKEEVIRLENTFQNDFALKGHLFEVKDELDSFVRKAEFCEVENDVSLMKQNIKRFVTKEEVMTRLTIIQTDITDKLNDRPK